MTETTDALKASQVIALLRADDDLYDSLLDECDF